MQLIRPFRPAYIASFLSLPTLPVSLYIRMSVLPYSGVALPVHPQNYGDMHALDQMLLVSINFQIVKHIALIFATDSDRMITDASIFVP